MNHLKAIVLLTLALAVLGCDNRSAATPVPASSVAVLDMDRIAKAMGWMDEINKSMNENESELKSQLADVITAQEKAVVAKRTAITTEAKLTPEQIKKLEAAKTTQDLDAIPLTPQQRQELSDAVAVANTDIQNARAQAAEALQNRRAKIIVSYRDKVRPIASRLATAKGMSVVLIPSDSLLYFDPKTADITDAVIEELQKIKSK